MEIDLSRFRDMFFQEAAEHLGAMEAGLLALGSGSADADTLDAVFRGAHSLKAGAGTFGFVAMGRLTHVLESLLDRMREGEMSFSADLNAPLLNAVDVLRELLDAEVSGRAPQPAWESLIEELDRLRVNGVATAESTEKGEATFTIGFAPSQGIFRMGLDPLLVLRDLARLGKVRATPRLEALPKLDGMDPETCWLAWNIELISPAGVEDIRDVFAFVEDLAVVTIERAGVPVLAAVPQSAAAPGPGLNLRRVSRDASIRVPTGKVDRLIDLVGELVIAQSMATQLMQGFTPDRLAKLQETVLEMERYTRELQERAMSIRMLAIGSVFSRFPRVVNDVARATGKQVTLEIEGEETELDKGVVEHIADALTHLVRNAIDHGIESPEDRRLAGKPESGCVTLRAYHQNGSVMVEVRDDGRGLNTERIRAKALERGLITSDQVLSDEQVHQLIFRPGFSTAEAVTDLSGRGVGMDVVRKSVEELNGTVSIETIGERGSVVRLKLPLTMAILDGLLLRVGEQTFVMPLASIVESIRPRKCDVRECAGRGEVMVVRREPVRMLRLGRVLHVDAEVEDPEQGLAVIVEHDGGHLALLVDELVGQQQVVVKSLDANFRKVRGITGATILGDGRAALILDIAGLAELASAA